MNFWPISDILQKNIIVYGLTIIFDLNDVNGSIIFILFFLNFIGILARGQTIVVGSQLHDSYTKLTVL